MSERKFLHLNYFVNRSAGTLALLPASLLLGCVLLVTPGCNSRGTPVPVEDSETSGRIKIVVAPELGDLVDREIRAFAKLYPQATIVAEAGDSRPAVGQLMSQQVDAIVVTRELEPEERTVVVKGGMELDGYPFARDAICVIVNEANPVQSMSVEDLRRVYQGEVEDWSALRGRPGRIRPVVPPVAGDLTLAFVQRVMGGQPLSVPAIRAASDAGVVDEVRKDPNAIGFVPLAWSGRGVRLLRVATLTGLPYVTPDAESIYDRSYPLTRSLNFYVRSRGPKLANGFVTFVSSWDGQKIVHEAGRVPTTIPVRFVRRSPMLGSH